MPYYTSTSYPYYRTYYNSCTTTSATTYPASPAYYTENDDYSGRLAESMKQDSRKKLILTMELRMAIDEETKKVITEESVSSVKRVLSELIDQISAAKKEVFSLTNQREEIKKEVTAILKQKDEIRSQIDNFQKQFKDMMAEVDQATEAYAKKNLRFALLDV